MKIKLQQLVSTSAGSGLTWAIGDVHGCAKTLKALYKRLNSPKKVYILGDYINRGPDSKAVIDFVMKHKEIVPLMGNHEHIFLNALNSDVGLKMFMKRGGDKTLASFGVETIDQIPAKYKKWIRSLGLFAKYKKFYLSHAGVDLNEKKKDPLRTSPKNIAFILYNRQVKAPKNSDHRIVVGHTPTKLTKIHESAEKGKVYIDGGCVYGGSLIAFCLDDNTIIKQPLIDEVTAE